MYLSKLVLNLLHRQARVDVTRAYELHRTLWRAFPEGDPGRVLFRVDSNRAAGHPVILVQSDLEPDWPRLPGAGYLHGSPECKAFDLTFRPAQRLRFRLRANPTKKIATASKSDRLSGKRSNGRRVPLLKEDEQVAWLLQKADQGGFRIPGQWIDHAGQKRANFRVELAPEGWVDCGKAGHADGRFHAVRFDGLLEIIDPKQFCDTVADGIGPAKGFGFGLLSLARAGE